MTTWLQKQLVFGKIHWTGCYDVPIHHVLGVPLFDEAQSLGEMIVENDTFMSELSNQEILFLDLSLKGQGPLQFFAGPF